MKIDLYQLDKRVDEGWLKKQSRGNLLVYAYTDKTNYEKAWDKYTTIARSLVVDKQGNVISKTLPKFWNLNERPETRLENLPRDINYGVYEKVDGTYLNAFNYEGKWQAATKASLDNEYIDFALEHLPNLPDINRNYACEVCLPRELDGLRRAVDHTPGLYYLAAFDPYQDFKELDWAKGAKEWESFGGVTCRIFDYTLEDLAGKLSKETQDLEGWVVRFDNGLRIKIKCFWFLKLFAFINNLDEKHIKEFILSYGIGNEKEWLQTFPEELREEAEEITNNLLNRYRGELTRITERFIDALGEAQTGDYSVDRKTFALSVKDDPAAWALFSLLDTKDISNKLMEKV